MIKNIIKKILISALIIASISTGIYGGASEASSEAGGISINVDTNTLIDYEGEDKPEEVTFENLEVSEMLQSEEVLGQTLEEFEEFSEDVFIATDAQGNITPIPIEEIETPNSDALANVKQINVDGVASISMDISYGVVVFNKTSQTTTYTDANIGVSVITHGAYAPDAAYLGLSNQKVKFKLSGAIGLCNSSDVTIYDYDDFIEAGFITSSYTTENGRIYHNITTNLKSIASTQHYGFQQSYMSDNATYYSYDGHYFYTSYKTMISDYKQGIYTNAINPKEPYYNYYMYLSHRSVSNFTASEFNSYLLTKTSNSKSKLINTGNDFVSLQNTYGANAALMYGASMNESDYGDSAIAQDKNNLFGHGAVDSNPYYGASGYNTVYDSIKYHAEYFVSKIYTAASYDWRYFGSHLGNKGSGMCVKYASDPYWGEKAASHSFQLEDQNSSGITDYNKYVIGITNANTYGSTPVYNSPNGKVLYYLKNKEYSVGYNMPVIILGSTTSDGVTWYRIQSDMPILSGRNSVLYSQKYNFTNDYAYVKASLVTEVNVKINEDVAYIKGDASGDGKVTSLDYILIKNHIMGTGRLSGTFLQAADTSGDGKITSLDYIQIRNHIMGATLLF